MIYIAHRGFRIDVPENSFLGFNRSRELKMDFIELDVHLSKDGHLFVIHDKTLDRTFQQTGLIKEKTQKELLTIKSGKFNQKIPLLNEVIEQLILPRNSSINLMIELKGQGTASPTCELIKQYGIFKRIVLSGRNLVELRKAHEILPRVSLCLNITKCQDFTLTNLFETNSATEFPLPFSMISLKSDKINSNKFPKKCRELGIKSLVWGFYDKSNPFSLMKTLVIRGVNGILFDDPRNVPIIRQYLKNQSRV